MVTHSPEVMVLSVKAAVAATTPTAIARAMVLAYCLARLNSDPELGELVLPHGPRGEQVQDLGSLGHGHAGRIRLVRSGRVPGGRRRRPQYRLSQPDNITGGNGEGCCFVGPCAALLRRGPVSAGQANPAASGSRPSDPVRAMQHALHRAAKANPERRFHALFDKVYRRDGSRPAVWLVDQRMEANTRQGYTAVLATPAIGRCGARRARTIRSPGAGWTPTGTSRGTGSGSRSGIPRSKRLASIGGFGSGICGMRTHRGCWPGKRTCKPSGNVLVTPG